MFDMWICVIPSFKHEAKDSYAFLKKEKKKKIIVFDYLDEKIFTALLRRKKQVRTYVFLDDVTGMRDLFYCSEDFIQCISQLRHLGPTTMTFCAHSLKRYPEHRIKGINLFYVHTRWIWASLKRGPMGRADPMQKIFQSFEFTETMRNCCRLTSSIYGDDF